MMSVAWWSGHWPLSPSLVYVEHMIKQLLSKLGYTVTTNSISDGIMTVQRPRLGYRGMAAQLAWH